MSIQSCIRAVVREKKRAAGVAWRRLHRVETILMLADEKLRPLSRPNAGKRRRRSRKPKVVAQQTVK